MSVRPLNRVTEEDTCLLYMRIDPYLKYRLQAAAAEVAEMEGIKDVSMSDIVEVCPGHVSAGPRGSSADPQIPATPPGRGSR